MRVVVAPDKFEGTLSAREAARALAAGWRRADRSAEVDEVPVADGGKGTLDALLDALGGRRERVRVTGPLGDPVEADFGLAETAGGRIAIVEMARASGIGLLSESRRDPVRATTRGTGELIAGACRHRPRRVLVCIGGSATNDGGAGMAQAVGIRLLDEEGEDLPAGGGPLRRLARIDASGLDPAVRGTEVVAACDVDNPLTGSRGASAVYGPQKGATPAQVRLLDESLGHLAAVIHRDLGLDVRDVPGAGAAGGLGAGLVAFLGARLRPGFEVVAAALDLDRRLDGADVAVTGEGSYDAQS
ncbi:MAG TPA: glycerate kinase, partial [Actinomycetota bacterium]|nr:glycerate kinase [Actinomycetota bacterium]